MKKLLFALACFFLFGTVIAQRTISGKVIDDKGSPLADVSVAVKGTSTGTTTKPDGTYSLIVPSNARTLVFTNVDMAPHEVTITSSSVISVTMTMQGKSLDEVVVVAYGTQVKRKVTGAVTKVSGTELENKPFASVDQLLQGKVPGLLSTSPTGQPGGAQQIRIRGIGSITASSAPLFVVDGVEIATGDFSRLSNTSNTLAGINPNDIESVTVLKDAAATALYGARAGNGVILISTKKGKPGKSKVRVDAEQGFGNTAYFNDQARPLNRDQYFTITKEGMTNAGLTQAQIDATLPSLGYNNTYDEDWVKQVTQPGSTQNLNASLSGGDNKPLFIYPADISTKKQSSSPLICAAIQLH
jgi:TonB-dependent SusC/RagA subfamily outer membrane receptor